MQPALARPTSSTRITRTCILMTLIEMSVACLKCRAGHCSAGDVAHGCHCDCCVRPLQVLSSFFALQAMVALLIWRSTSSLSFQKGSVNCSFTCSVIGHFLCACSKQDRSCLGLAE